MPQIKSRIYNVSTSEEDEHKVVAKYLNSNTVGALLFFVSRTALCLRSIHAT